VPTPEVSPRSPSIYAVSGAADPQLAPNLRGLIALRAILLAGALFAILIARWVFDIALPLGALVAVLGALALITVFTALRHRHRPGIGEGEFFGQILIDMLALSLLLYFSGGPANPFVMLYWLPLSMTAATLPGRYTFAITGATIAAYSALMLLPLPAGQEHATHGSFGQHVLGMWLGFVLGALLISVFGVRMANSLRTREAALARLREQQLRDERIVALGTLAAGAAHELGTPLSTMAVVTGELADDASLGTVQREQIALLRTQVRRCKAILGQLAASAGQDRAEGGRALPLDRYLDELVQQFRNMRSQVALTARMDGARPAPDIVSEETLSQVIVSLLNNAADASPGAIELAAHWDAATLDLEVRDHGPGFSAAARQSAGRRIYSGKAPEQGMGLGLYLAAAALERLGGDVQFFNHDDGGACARLTLPLAPLLAR
jgi:two-component system sensor histidine kinase RegB